MGATIRVGRVSGGRILEGGAAPPSELVRRGNGLLCALRDMLTAYRCLPQIPRQAVQGSTAILGNSRGHKLAPPTKSQGTSGSCLVLSGRRRTQAFPLLWVMGLRTAAFSGVHRRYRCACAHYKYEKSHRRTGEMRLFLRTEHCCLDSRQWMERLDELAGRLDGWPKNPC